MLEQGLEREGGKMRCKGESDTIVSLYRISLRLIVQNLFLIAQLMVVHKNGYNSTFLTTAEFLYLIDLVSNCSVDTYTIQNAYTHHTST